MTLIQRNIRQKAHEIGKKYTVEISHLNPIVEVFDIEGDSVFYAAESVEELCGAPCPVFLNEEQYVLFILDSAGALQ